MMLQYHLENSCKFQVHRVLVNISHDLHYCLSVPQLYINSPFLLSFLHPHLHTILFYSLTIPQPKATSISSSLYGLPHILIQLHHHYYHHHYHPPKSKCTSHPQPSFSSPSSPLSSLHHSHRKKIQTLALWKQKLMSFWMMSPPLRKMLPPLQTTRSISLIISSNRLAPCLDKTELEWLQGLLRCWLVSVR